MTSILPKFKIDIVNGNIVPEKDVKYNLYLQSLEGKKESSKHLNGFELSIKPIRGKRSIDHNDFYWTIVNPLLASEMGSKSRFDAHEELVMMMYPNGETKQRKLYNGNIQEWTERKKTSEMNVREFTEFVEWCKDFGVLEFQIVWPKDYEEDNL